MVILLFQIGSHGTVIHLKGDVLVAVCAVPIVFCVRGVLWELNPPFPAAEFAVYTALSFLQKPDRMPGFCGNTRQHFRYRSAPARQDSNLQRTNSFLLLSLSKSAKTRFVFDAAQRSLPHLRVGQSFCCLNQSGRLPRHREASDFLFRSLYVPFMSVSYHKAA